MATPVKTFGDFVICFNAGEEAISARQHFVKVPYIEFGGHSLEIDYFKSADSEDNKEG